MILYTCINILLLCIIVYPKQERKIISNGRLQCYCNMLGLHVVPFMKFRLLFWIQLLKNHNYSSLCKLQVLSGVLSFLFYLSKASYLL